MTHSSSRRGFLRTSAQAGMLGALGSLGLLSAAPARAAVGDYKALVCIYLFGGNDGNNMVVPLDATRYAQYTKLRGPAGLALSVNAGTLLAKRTATLQTVAAPTSQDFAFHFGLKEIDQLYGQGNVAVVLNTGSLRQPLTKSQYMAGTGVPPQLFSHPDQTLQNQSGSPAGGGTGWGGRLVDLLGTGGHLDAIALGTGGLFVEGTQTHGNQLPANGALSIAGMNFWPQAQADTRKAALKAILASANQNAVQAGANQALLNGMNLVDDLAAANASGALATAFPASNIGVQFKTVTQLIKMRMAQGPGRQVFFVSLGGFDTHGGQAWQQQDLFQQLAPAIAAFQQGLAEISAARNVTSFTMSDFGRTLMPNSSGTDHAWGNHQLVIGAAVQGGVYGQFPDFNLASSPDDATGRGAWIPQFSNQQFGATLGRWFGADPAALDAQVFKGELSKFPVTDLGFMG